MYVSAIQNAQLLKMELNIRINSAKVHGICTLRDCIHTVEVYCSCEGLGYIALSSECVPHNLKEGNMPTEHDAVQLCPYPIRALELATSNSCCS